MILDKNTFNISTKLTEYGKDYLRNNGKLDIKYFSISDSGIDYADTDSASKVHMYENAEVDINNIGSMLLHVDVEVEPLNITIVNRVIEIINKIPDIDEDKSYITIINSGNRPIKLYYYGDSGSGGIVVDPGMDATYRLIDGLNQIPFSVLYPGGTVGFYIIDNRTNIGQFITE